MVLAARTWRFLSVTPINLLSNHPWIVADRARSHQRGVVSDCHRPHIPCTIECILIYKGVQWLVQKATTSEMRSSMPRLAYLLSAVSPLPQRQRYQNRLASQRELFLPTSRPRTI